MSGAVRRRGPTDKPLFGPGDAEMDLTIAPPRGRPLAAGGGDRRTKGKEGACNDRKDLRCRILYVRARACAVVTRMNNVLGQW